MLTATHTGAMPSENSPSEDSSSEDSLTKDLLTKDSRTENSSTEDGRYIVVDGRRWRATDPAIPEALRKELVAELMAARRDVRVDPANARPRVGDAKVALGERGDPWWQPSPAGQRTRLEAAIRTLLRHRSPTATICPSDAARVAGGTAWRDLMDLARSVAAELAQRGIVVVRQHGVDVDIATATGPVRLARGPDWEPAAGNCDG
jgi:Protein of unknown function (DUF3253)